ncbi:hypothetical protein TTHERM_000299749 (macronuclear) [Tetrahymena thermophila SB210]|uniref:Uncharacterized protein n=1 Tax=Tetrahymena thermophila (strain SB210) TaxID=312017 RepID=W7X690_TETTS|nr:hypothetical protein TTHERM_000299749 [Tetrahymena thermophila SB210]EWS71853.1 hypothetical protein TTHERM_000299749 [Tetrahymena thermophila SB210]|eukprot:XP_012655597.1 hypothetical protein TTHERM_000299749 [Tetrahymena thermophila SB210]
MTMQSMQDAQIEFWLNGSIKFILINLLFQPKTFFTKKFPKQMINFFKLKVGKMLYNRKQRKNFSIQKNFHLRKMKHSNIKQQIINNNKTFQLSKKLIDNIITTNQIRFNKSSTTQQQIITLYFTQQLKQQLNTITTYQTTKQLLHCKSNQKSNIYLFVLIHNIYS